MLLLPSLLLIFIGGVYVLFRRYFHRCSLLKRCGFPVVPSNSVFGNLHIFACGSSFRKFGELSKKYGRTYGIMRGSLPTIVTSDPRLIRMICLGSFSHFHARAGDPMEEGQYSTPGLHLFQCRGARWKRLRTVLSSAFSLHAMREWFPRMEQRTESLLDLLPLHRPLHRTLQRHTAGVIEDCSFSGKGSREWRNVVESFGAEAAWPPAALAYAFPEVAMVLRGVAAVQEWLLPSSPPLRVFTDFTRQLASSRDNEGNFDFLRVMKGVQRVIDDYEEEREAEGPSGIFESTQHRVEKAIDVEELPNQLRFVSIAGFDTTANTLTILFWLLASREDVQCRLRSEVLDVDARDESSLGSLLYLNAVVQETLRLFPHASPLHTRRCTSSIALGSYFIPSGVDVFVDTWSLHRDRGIWGEDAEEFRPERHLSPLPPGALLIPFGMGPRQCIGMRFALLEIRLAVVRVLQTFVLLPVETKVRFSLRDTNTIWPEGIRVIFKRLL